jgi:hypothetical protein
MEKKEIKKMVLEIVDSLYNRGGFDDWWGNLDDDIEEEIIKEIEDIIEKRIVKYNFENKLLSNNWRNVIDDLPTLFENSNGEHSEVVLTYIETKDRMEYKEQLQLAYYSDKGWCYQDGELMYDEDVKGLKRWKLIHD